MRRCEDVRMWRWEDVRMWGCEDEKMWRWTDMKMRRCEDEQMWRWEDVKMRRCEDEQMWRWVRMWGCEDVKMRRCEDVRMWRWEDVKMNRCEGEKMCRCEDEKMWRFEDIMRRCEDVKMYDRPPLLEEPFVQTLSWKKNWGSKWNSRNVFSSQSRWYISLFQMANWRSSPSWHRFGRLESRHIHPRRLEALGGQRSILSHGATQQPLVNRRNPRTGQVQVQFTL